MKLKVQNPDASNFPLHAPNQISRKNTAMGIIVDNLTLIFIHLPFQGMHLQSKPSHEISRLPKKNQPWV